MFGAAPSWRASGGGIAMDVEYKEAFDNLPVGQAIGRNRVIVACNHMFATIFRGSISGMVFAYVVGFHRIVQGRCVRAVTEVIPDRPRARCRDSTHRREDGKRNCEGAPYQPSYRRRLSHAVTS